MRLARVAILLAAVTLSGCGGDTSPSTPPIVGSWAAVSVDGTRLPATNSQGVTFYAHTLTIMPGGEYTRSITDGVGTQTLSLSEAGAWVADRTGSTWVLSPNVASNVARWVTMQGNQLAFTFGADVWIMQRQ